jgi:hypothetical protein
VHGAISKEEGRTEELPSWYVQFLKIQGMKPSYMAIKKAIYGRQPGRWFFCFRFALDFYFVSLLWFILLVNCKDYPFGYKR